MTSIAIVVAISELFNSPHDWSFLVCCFSDPELANGAMGKHYVCMCVHLLPLLLLRLLCVLPLLLLLNSYTYMHSLTLIYLVIRIYCTSRYFTNILLAWGVLCVYVIFSYTSPLPIIIGCHWWLHQMYLAFI